MNGDYVAIQRQLWIQRWQSLFENSTGLNIFSVPEWTQRLAAKYPDWAHAGENFEYWPTKNPDKSPGFRLREYFVAVEHQSELHLVGMFAMRVSDELFFGSSIFGIGSSFWDIQEMTGHLLSAGKRVKDELRMGISLGRPN